MAATAWHSTFLFLGEKWEKSLPVSGWSTPWAWTTDSAPERHTPPRLRWSGLGSCNVDLWSFTWTWLWWSVSCWATLGLMNKRSPKRRRISTKSHDWGAEARLRRWIFFWASMGNSLKRPSFSKWLLMWKVASLFLQNVEELPDAWGAKMLIMYRPFPGDLSSRRTWEKAFTHPNAAVYAVGDSAKKRDTSVHVAVDELIPSWPLRPLKNFIHHFPLWPFNSQSHSLFSGNAEQSPLSPAACSPSAHMMSKLMTHQWQSWSMKRSQWGLLFSLNRFLRGYVSLTRSVPSCCP